MSRPTICFATMCKNEEHCIQETLACVAPFIDYWVVSDTGSTDRTCEIVEAFFRQKGIPGELHRDEWVGFDVNKTLLFQHAYKKADYVLHLDADDLLEGEFSFTAEEAGKLSYKCWAKRGDHSSCRYLVQLMFDNRHVWKFAGVAHTIIRCLDNTEGLEDGSLADKHFILNSRDTGNRSNDAEKYAKDATKLRDQFFRTLVDDPDGINARSVFYAAQSYRDSSQWLESIQWYSLYTRLKNTWNEEVYMSYWNMGNMYNRLGNLTRQKNHTKKLLMSLPIERRPTYLWAPFTIIIGAFKRHMICFIERRKSNSK